MKHLIGNADILFITLDTLRYDAAQKAWRDGRLETLGPYLGNKGWEKRHTPGSFTYAAHHAFFSGFLPTPLGNGPHARLFAALSKCKGDFLMSYDNTVEVVQLAKRHGFECKPIAMKSTHHAKMTELLIGKDLSWVND